MEKNCELLTFFYYVVTVDRLRASWNAGLEKALVDLLHEFSRVSFTKVQIQDKERELKRDYKVLKEARKQSGVSWDERLCRIEAEEPIWDNIIMSFPKAKKFRMKSFPLFEALGELYDGMFILSTCNFVLILVIFKLYPPLNSLNSWCRSHC